MYKAPEKKENGKPKHSLSFTLLKLLHIPEEKISLRTMRDVFADRSMSAMLLICSLFNMLPFPPGSSAIIGIPLVLIAAQMTLGHKVLWLPQALLNLTIKPKRLKTLRAKIIPKIFWLEKYIRPRYWPAKNKIGIMLIHFFCLLLAILVTIPIPLGNWLPACSLAILAIALCEKDGIFLGIGIVMGIISFLIAIIVVFSAWSLAHYLI